MGLIVLTSSRDASIRMRQFLNELELVIPNAVKVNRGGKSSIIEIAGKALALGGPTGYFTLVLGGVEIQASYAS